MTPSKRSHGWFALVAVAALIGCGHSAREAKSAGAANAPNATGGGPAAVGNRAEEAPRTTTPYPEQRGFEDELHAPDAYGGGPKTPAVDSDVGAPRWRNNPGSYDDRKPQAPNAPR
jgi:hypothetical protein